MGSFWAELSPLVELLVPGGRGSLRRFCPVHTYLAFSQSLTGAALKRKDFTSQGGQLSFLFLSLSCVLMIMDR